MADAINQASSTLARRFASLDNVTARELCHYALANVRRGQIASAAVAREDHNSRVALRLEQAKHAVTWQDVRELAGFSTAAMVVLSLTPLCGAYAPLALCAGHVLLGSACVAGLVFTVRTAMGYLRRLRAQVEVQHFHQEAGGW